MNEHYSENKEEEFWENIGSEYDGSTYGSEGKEYHYIEYYFDKSNIDNIKRGIKNIEWILGDNKKKVDDFFSKDKKRYKTYNDEMMIAEGFNRCDIKDVLKRYASLKLGEKILKKVEENGEYRYRVSVNCY